MNDPLREAGNLSQRYERPQQAWVCGWAAQGRACSFGPDPSGRCEARAECVPHRDGDRWQCARSAANGGPCDDGPLPDGHCGCSMPPCQPVRSLRARRGLLAFSTAAISFGAILFLLGGPARREFLSPGELTFEHGTVTQSCESCHKVAGDHAGALIEQASEPHDALAQTRLCLGCHDLGGHPTQAHGMPAGSLHAASAEAGGASAASPLLMAAARGALGAPASADGELACARCHREHQGRQADLKFLDNQQCQACHARQFSSLAQGHPEFDGYPFKRRTALVFDHEAHLGRHFKDFSLAGMSAGKPLSACTDCHAPDRPGRMMLVNSFDQMCASCHLEQITDTTLGGIRFFNLPAFDVERLAAQPSTAAGEWPDAATAAPTPFLKLLLASRSDAEALQGVDLADLSAATPGQLQAAGRLLWNVKELMFDLVREGDHALGDRLARLTDPPLSAQRLTLLEADLSPATVRAAQENWLPTLFQEMPAKQADEPLPKAEAAAAPFAQPASVRWLLDDADGSLQYRPRRHRDLFLRAWLDLTGEHYSSPTVPQFAEVFDYLASPYSPGGCTKCHSVEAQTDGSRRVNWKPAEPHAQQHAFTAFAHQPHFALVEGNRCENCHALRSGSQYVESFFNADHSLNVSPKHFAGNFLPIEKAQCDSCHAAGKASASCLLCHNYHVGEFSPNRAGAKD